MWSGLPTKNSQTQVELRCRDTLFAAVKGRVGFMNGTALVALVTHKSET